MRKPANLASNDSTNENFPQQASSLSGQSIKARLDSNTGKHFFIVVGESHENCLSYLIKLQFFFFGGGGNYKANTNDFFFVPYFTYRAKTLTRKNKKTTHCRHA